MATGFPQFEETQPVLNTVKINDESSGHEAFAKVLGSLAEQTEQEIPKMLSEESESMYMSSVANIKQLQTGAQVRMLHDPDQAAKIGQQTSDIIDEVQQNTRLNNKDRARLNYFVQTARDDIELNAAKTEVSQRQIQAAFTHYSNWESQLQAYQNALMTDPKLADQLHEGMIGSLHNLVTIKAMTPLQAAASMKAMGHIASSVERMHRMGYSGEATAQDYHTETSNLLSQGSDTTHAPINASTGWLIDYHNSDKSFQGVMADISNRKLPSPETFVSLSEDQQDHAYLAMRGVQEADGMINSGISFPEVQHEYNSLAKENKVLSYKDQAKKVALGNYLAELRGGDYLTVMAKTPVGNSIMRDFTNRNAAIQNSAADPDQKAQMIIQNKNKMVDAAISYGEGTHTPAELIQPIPASDVANTQNGFKVGQDPAIVLQTLGQYSKTNQLYLAEAMKNPNQRMVVNAVALLPPDIKAESRLEFIAANQTGVTFLNKSVAENEKEPVLMARISTNIAPALRMVADNYGFLQGKPMQDAMLKTTMNYAKYLAQKDYPEGAGGVPDSRWKDYVDEASRIYKSAYARQSGTNWVVNPQQLPQPMTMTDLDILADHVTNLGYERLKEGRSSLEYYAATQRNPLKMIISPKNEVQAVDGNGNVYYAMPFTTNVLPFAREHKKRRIEEARLDREENMRLIPDVNP